MEAFHIQEKIIQACLSSQVVLVVGPPGCGKSTLVPSILLNDSIVNGSGAMTNILVTEPRGIAAISLAKYVAELRGEVQVGRHVGYQVGCDSCLPLSTGSITFCTTGILLARLRTDPDLTIHTHMSSLMKCMNGNSSPISLYSSFVI